MQSQKDAPAFFMSNQMLPFVEQYYKTLIKITYYLSLPCLYRSLFCVLKPFPCLSGPCPGILILITMPIPDRVRASLQ